MWVAADTLNEKDFKPNDLETLFTEPRDAGLLTNAHDRLGIANLNEPEVLPGGADLNTGVGSLTVDMFTPYGPSAELWEMRVM